MEKFLGGYSKESLVSILDELVKDENPAVRKAVVEKGYALEILGNDEDPDVREAALERGKMAYIRLGEKDPYVYVAIQSSIHDDSFEIK